MPDSFKEISRGEWANSSGPQGTIEQVQTGSMQRMADALELIAKDRQKLLDSKEYYEEKSKRYQQYYENEQRRVAALRGVITKLRKKL